MKIMDTTNKPIDLEDEIKKLETSVLNSKNKINNPSHDYSATSVHETSHTEDNTQDNKKGASSFMNYVHWVYFTVPVVVGTGLYAIKPNFVMKKKKKKLDTQKLIMYGVFISAILMLVIYLVKKYKK